MQGSNSSTSATAAEPAQVPVTAPMSNGVIKSSEEQSKAETTASQGKQPAAKTAERTSKAAPTLPPRNAVRVTKATNSGSSSSASSNSSSNAVAVPAAGQPAGSSSSNAAGQQVSAALAHSSSSSSSSKPKLARPNSTGKLTAVNAPGGTVKAMPSLPARASSAAAAGGAVVGVIDPEEPEATQKLRANVHDIRVRLVRAARRLGYEHDNGLVKQVRHKRGPKLVTSTAS